MTDDIWWRSASDITSGAAGPPPTGGASGPTSERSSKTPISLLGPAECSDCGARVYWYNDNTWREFREQPHRCGGYYAAHRKENPLLYQPLHALDPPPPGKRAR